MAGSVGSRSSFNKIAKVLGITVDTVKEYIGYFEEAFLIKMLTKWSSSQADKIYAQKKIYLYDTGLKTMLTGSGDREVKIENLVFFHLLKKNVTNIGYYAESERELDFAFDNFQSPQAIEVKYDSQFDWQDKRFRGVKLFCKRYPHTREVTIITKDAEQTIQDDKLRIFVIPAWKYLLYN